MTSFRFGVLVGGVAGYVLGARAGRQRYEQIASMARSASRSRPAQQLSSEVRQVTDRTKDVIGERATEGVARVTSAVRSKVPGSSSQSNGAPSESQL